MGIFDAQQSGFDRSCSDPHLEDEGAEAVGFNPADYFRKTL